MLIDINVVSDFVCPWCYLGKVRLNQAVSQFVADHPHTVRTHWLPFFLNADTPARGEPYRPFLERKFGSPRAVDELFARVRDAAEADGVRFAFESIQMRPNTLRAHRLVYRAQSLGVRPEQLQSLVHSLFEAYFEQGRDIGDIDTLADLAVAAGDRRDEIVEYLSGTADAGAVQRMAGQVLRQGVEGVPFVILNRSLAVSGAQSVPAFGAALREAAGVKLA